MTRHPGNHHTIFVDECPDCEGSGWIEGEITGVCHQTGAPLSNSYRCSTCQGRGEVETEYECRTLEDLEREAEEDQTLADGTHYLDISGSLQPKP